MKSFFLTIFFLVRLEWFVKSDTFYFSSSLFGYFFKMIFWKQYELAFFFRESVRMSRRVSFEILFPPFVLISTHIGFVILSVVWAPPTTQDDGDWFFSLSLFRVFFFTWIYIYKVFICLCMCPLSAPRSQCRAGCGFLPIRDRDEWEPRKRKSQEKIRGPQVWNQQGSLLLSLFPNQLGKMPQ